MNNFIGIIGDGIMGRGITQHLADQQVSVCLLGHHLEKIDKIKSINIQATTNEKIFLQSLPKQKIIFLFLPWSPRTITYIKKLSKKLQPKDIIVDFANAKYEESALLQKYLKKNEIDYIACGISGGEQGALRGTSLMASGNKIAYKKVEPILNKLSDKDKSNNPTLGYFGSNTEGHLIKTLHNTIEYTLLDSIGSIILFLRKQGMQSKNIAELFPKKHSYLSDLTIKVLETTKNNTPLWELIDPTSESKGTGIWGVQNSIDVYSPAMGSTGALATRFASQNKKYQEMTYKTTTYTFNHLEKILDQIFSLAYDEILDVCTSLKLNTKEILRVWENGCIIRWNKPIKNLKEINALRKLATDMINNGHPCPAILGLISYYDLKNSPTLHTNYIQAMRDAFGAHTYKRIGKPGIFHSLWNQS